MWPRSECEDGDEALKTGEELEARLWGRKRRAEGEGESVLLKARSSSVQLYCRNDTKRDVDAFPSVFQCLTLIPPLADTLLTGHFGYVNFTV